MKKIMFWLHRFVMAYGIIMLSTFFMYLLFNPTSELPVVTFFGRCIVFTLVCMATLVVYYSKIDLSPGAWWFRTVLHWTSEIIPIKQSTPVAVALFGGWMIVVAVAGCYYLLHPYIGAETFPVCAAFLFIVADSVFLRWLMGKGAKIFEQLK